VCGERDAASLGGSCSGALGWEAAQTFCEDAGARLCTSDELLNEETADTGCVYDSELIWSQTSCGSGSYLVAIGDSTTHGTTTTCVTSTSTAYYAACCADTVACAPTPTPTIVPTPQPTSTPAPTGASACSQLTCSELGDFDNTLGDSTVCGERDAASLGGSCSGALGWEAAQTFCEDAGARLCTSDELIGRETKNTGCSYDAQLLWSKTECGDGKYLVAYGDSAKHGNTTTCLNGVNGSKSTTSSNACIEWNPSDSDGDGGCPTGWTCTGDAQEMQCSNSIVSGVLSNCDSDGGFFQVAGDSETGEAVSDSFYLPSDATTIKYTRGGGADSPSGLYVKTVASDAIICQSTDGTDADNFFEVTGDISSGQGLEVYVELLDSQSSGWGKVWIDEIEFLDSSGNSLSVGCSYPTPAPTTPVPDAYAACCADVVGCSPTPLPTPQPSPVPTTPVPSPLPSPQPTPLPTSVPTSLPTPLPTPEPSPVPTTPVPSPLPTPGPSPVPTTPVPSPLPSPKPSPVPSVMPSTYDKRAYLDRNADKTMLRRAKHIARVQKTKDQKWAKRANHG